MRCSPSQQQHRGEGTYRETLCCYECSPLDGEPLDVCDHWVKIVDSKSIRDGFTQAMNAMLDDPAMSGEAKMIYLIMLSHAWNDDRRCWPGYHSLQKRTGWGERAIRKAIRELEDIGLITAHRRGQGKTNIYEVALYHRSTRAYNEWGYTQSRLNAGSRPDKSQFVDPSLRPAEKNLLMKNRVENTDTPPPPLKGGHECSQCSSTTEWTVDDREAAAVERVFAFFKDKLNATALLTPYARDQICLRLREVGEDVVMYAIKYMAGIDFYQQRYEDRTTAFFFGDRRLFERYVDLAAGQRSIAVDLTR